MNPDAKPLFARACDTLGVNTEVRQASWRAIADLQLDPDDPTVILLAIGQAFSTGSRKMLMQLEALPAKIEMQALCAVAGMTTGLQNDLVEAARAEMRAALQAQRLDQDKRMRAELRRRLAGVVAGMMLALAMIIVTFGAVGYALGRSEARGLADDMARAATSASAGDWLRIMHLNPDFALATDCAPASGNAYEAMDGSTVCSVRIDKDTPPKSRWELFVAQVRRDLIWVGPVMAALLGAGAGYAIRAKERGDRQR